MILKIKRLLKEKYDDHYVYDAGIVNGYQYIRIRLRIPWHPVPKLGLPIVFKINLKTRRMYRVLDFDERMEACERHSYTPIDLP